MSSPTSSVFPLATIAPCTTDCGNGAGTANSAGIVDSDAGAGGSTDNTFALSEGGMIAIIVIVVLVGLVGIGSAAMFYIAKKKEWQVRETIRRSARKVVTALTPRRTEFPSSVKEGSIRSKSGRGRVEDVPPTPRIRPEDLEKGLAVKVNARKYFGRK